MIRRLYRLAPDPALLLRLGGLHVAVGVLQGVLLGLLVPVLRPLLQAQPDWEAAEPWLGVAAVCLLAYVALVIVATPVGFDASARLGAQLRHRVMAHVSALPLGWFDASHKRRLARAVTADVSKIAQLAVTIGAPAIVATVVPATVLAVTFAVDWRMGLVLLAVAPPAVVALRRAARVTAEVDIELEHAAEEIAGRAVEFGQAQPVLRATGHGRTGTPRLRAALERHEDVYRRGLRRAMAPDLTYVAVVMAGFAVSLAVGVQLHLDGAVAVADTVVLLLLAIRFLEPLGAHIELVGALRAMDQAIRRVDAILRTPTLPTSASPVERLDDATVELAHVTFAYDETPVLRDVSLRCAPGTITALVGASGSGKSTVLRLVARFFDVDGGSVRIGGVDVRELDAAALMDDVAIVFQDVYLFDDTIEANVRLARPDATWGELAAAASAARLDDVIARLPEGWGTRVGEGGAQLSGGERQRVAIARAWLKQARIVLLDEVSSALDPENEAAIAGAIAALGEDPRRTVIVIAHAPATLAAADQVVTLADGRVVETGTPDELRRRDGAFARLAAQHARARSWRIGTGA